MRATVKAFGATNAVVALFVLLATGCGTDSQVNLEQAQPEPSQVIPELVSAGQEPTTGQDSFTIGVTRVGQQLAPAVRGKTVAVLRFPDFQNRPTQLGSVVAERLTTALVQSVGGNARVVERIQVEQVIGELEDQRNELAIQDQRAIAVGGILGADVVVLGTAGVLDGRAIVSARAVNVNDGSVAAAGEFVTRATREVEVQGSNVVEPPPAERKPLDILLDRPVIETVTNGPVQAQTHGCTRTGRWVLCAITMRALDIDTRISMSRSRSSATDDRGNTLQPGFTVGREQQSDRQGLLVADIPTPAQVWIEGVPLSARAIARVQLRMTVHPDGRDFFYSDFVFRNLPIQ